MASRPVHRPVTEVQEVQGGPALIHADVPQAVIGQLARNAPVVGPRRSGPRLTVLRDRSFLAVMGFSALLSQAALLDVGLPLWVSERTATPTAIIGIVFVMNCALVAAFTVRMSKGHETPLGAARSGRRSSFTVALACVLLAVTGSIGATQAAVILAIAMVVQAFGKMQHSAQPLGPFVWTGRCRWPSAISKRSRLRALDWPTPLALC